MARGPVLSVRADREIVELNRAIVPLAAPLRRLVASPSSLVPDQIRSYFRDVEDHLTHWSFGYYLALGVMAGVCGVLYVVFRRNRWL